MPNQAALLQRAFTAKCRRLRAGGATACRQLDLVAVWCDACLLNGMADALSAAPAPAWQPIETVPKDGSRVALYAKVDGRRHLAVSSWLPEFFCDGWGVVPAGFIVKFAPQFWMPLPASPDATAEDRE